MRTVIAQRVADAAHGRAFAAYNAARNAAELGALAAGGALVGALGARNALVVAGLGPVIAALLGLAALRHERPQQLRDRVRGAHAASDSSAARRRGGISVGRRPARSTKTCTNQPSAASSAAPRSRSPIS